MKKDKLEKLVLPGINLLVGAGKGVIDILITGLFLASVGLELFRLDSYLNHQNSKNSIFDISFKNDLRYTGSSLLGSSIPFGIKHYSEVYNFLEGVLK